MHRIQYALRRTQGIEVQVEPVRNEKVRGSNPLSSTREAGPDLRKCGSVPVSSCEGMYPLRTPATYATGSEAVIDAGNG